MVREYRTTGHAVFDIQYHLCWCTKYRYGVLRGEIGVRCRDLLREIAMAREITVIRGALAPDHVHMLVAAPPTISVAHMVQYLKGRSSRKLQMEYEELRRRYWGQHLWARGYFCATVGAVTEEMIKRYIEEQRWDDDGGKGFKIIPER
jgi:putative transposase